MLISGFHVIAWIELIFRILGLATRVHFNSSTNTIRRTLKLLNTQ